nr:MAG TPA: hypothetical protein [Caudoviricetes sp.]
MIIGTFQLGIPLTFFLAFTWGLFLSWLYYD